MAEDRALVKNAADEQQVKEAGKRQMSVRDRELSDVAVVMSTPQGRRFMWRLMGHCKTYQSIWESSAKIHYNAGQQDIGHFLMSEILSSSEDTYQLMVKESNKEKLNG